MSERGLPPYPLGGDWKTWATQLVEYLSNQARSEEFVAPRSVGLSHQLPNEVYRAFEDGVMMYDPERKFPVFSEDGVWKAIAAIEDYYYMKWQGSYVPGSTYNPNDVVLDWPYLMIANKETDDPPAPQDVGPPFFVYTGAEPTQAITAKTLLVGNTYTTPVALKVPAVRVYTITGNLYSVYLRILSTGQITELLTFTANSTGWFEIPGAGNLIAAGTQFEVALYVTEPDPMPVTFVGNWNYTTPNNAGTPSSGQISHANKARDSLRVHKTDNDGGDRSADLAGMTVGDTIEAAGTRWSISAIVDNGTWIDFSVAPQSQLVDGLYSFTFETVTVSPITVIADPDFYLGNADVRPFYSIDGGTRVLTDDAYNVDIQIQEVNISPDWDLMAISGSGGTSGGGGTANTIGDTFPTGISAGHLHYKTGEYVGLYIWYDDGDSQQWVQTNGSVVLSSNVTVFHDPTRAISWRLDEETKELEFWGFVPSNAGANPYVINLPKTFARNPEVTATIARSGSGFIFSDDAENTPSSISIRRTNSSTSGVQWEFYWRAKGEWDGVS